MLEFIFSNPLILFIVIGLIGALFRKRKEAQPVRPRQQGPAMPTFANEEPQPAKGFSQTAVRKEKSDYAAALEAYEQADGAKPMRPEPRTAPPFPRTISRPEETKRVRKSQERRLSAEEARLGMMWSEVFAPPRAKRSYRR